MPTCFFHDCFVPFLGNNPDFLSLFSAYLLRKFSISLQLFNVIVPCQFFKLRPTRVCAKTACDCSKTVKTSCSKLKIRQAIFVNIFDGKIQVVK